MSMQSTGIILVRQGNKFPPEYLRLFDHLEGVTTLTDQDDTPGDTVRMKTRFKGWWAKMELFAPHFPLRPCLFFDLDTYVLGNVDDLRQPTEELFLIRDFYHPDKRSNSGVMRIPEDTSEIWRRFQQGGHGHGDGDFLNKCPHQRIQDHFDGIVSYKVHARDKPRGRVVCFHGWPKPHQADGWAGEEWKRLTSPNQS